MQFMKRLMDEGKQVIVSSKDLKLLNNYSRVMQGELLTIDADTKSHKSSTTLLTHSQTLTQVSKLNRGINTNQSSMEFELGDVQSKQRGSLYATLKKLELTTNATTVKTPSQ